MLQVEDKDPVFTLYIIILIDINQKDEFIPVWEMAMVFLKKQQDLRMVCAPAVTLRASETWLMALLVLGQLWVQGCSTAMLPPP